MQNRFLGLLKIFSFTFLLSLFLIACLIITLGLYADREGRKFAAYNPQIHVSHDHRFVKTPDGSTIHYVLSGNDQECSSGLVVLLHGAPGSASFFDFQNDNTCVVSINRKGYGFSDPHSFETDLCRHADHVHTILEDIRYSGSVTLYGHSYGGSVALCYAQKYADENLRLILSATPVDPDTKWRKPCIRTFSIPGLKSIAYARHIGRLVSACYEMAHLQNGLQKLFPKLRNIRAPITILHSREDQVVPFENAEMLRDILPEGQVEIIDDFGDVKADPGYWPAHRIHVFARDFLSTIIKQTLKKD